jgi:hypothetical protein
MVQLAFKSAATSEAAFGIPNKMVQDQLLNQYHSITTLLGYYHNLKTVVT